MGRAACEVQGLNRRIFSPGFKVQPERENFATAYSGYTRGSGRALARYIMYPRQIIGLDKTMVRIQLICRMSRPAHRARNSALAATNAAIQNSMQKLAATTRLGAKKRIYRKVCDAAYVPCLAPAHFQNIW